MRAAFSPLELPIMLLASRSGEAQALAALEAGVNDFLITAAPHRAAGTHQQPGDSWQPRTGSLRFEVLTNEKQV